VKDIARRCDRIGPVEERATRELRGRDKSERSGLVAGDSTVGSRFELRLLDAILTGEELERAGIVVAGLDCEFVGPAICGLFLAKVASMRSVNLSSERL